MLAPLLAPRLATEPGIRHGFFTREGGVSEGIYGSLNCGLGSADQRERVQENRRRVAVHLATSADRLLTAYQIHSASAVVVDAPWPADEQPRADALVTRTRGLALGALAADCAPVLFADPAAGVIGATHAGWRGALGGILEATIEAMESLGARRQSIIAAIGPCIGADAYEVGPEFQATFLDADLHNEKFFRRPAGAERPYFDLPGFINARLVAAGAGSIGSCAACTYTNADRFFSFRRTTHAREHDYGRQISAIALL